MPKLWDATIDEHRRTVEAAILDAAAAVIAEQGLATVTMSSIAQRAGIGRATLYKYFGDVDAIVTAWHERQVAEHLRQLEQAAATVGDPDERLQVVLRAYAELSGGPHDHGGPPAPGMLVALHGGAHVREALQRLRALIAEVIAAASATGAVRDDFPTAEMADYCLHALAAARVQHSSAARDRLVTLILDGLRPTTGGAPRTAEG
ncbi:TetR/AcrR family transcriptional regulator [Cryptosporangium minutisporangium]|uniref:TetR/AcrR family transcriptional regulator n=1 Tax=Cryptosporangium minutisporangium TaxID=113569 RepID=A0ABP6T114_9ACTN